MTPRRRNALAHPIVSGAVKVKLTTEFVDTRAGEPRHRVHRGLRHRIEKAAVLWPWPRVMGIAFRHEPKVEYGVASTISPLIRRVVARNPSPFTYHGTGTYLIGHGEVAVVD